MAHPSTPKESDILCRVRVRLLLESERSRFDRLLTEQHSLHDPILTGQSLRYVAELDGHWVALIAFSAAALHLKAREAWIGWTPRQRARRLPFVVNNSRSLGLAERQRDPNLASRVLGLCLRRVSADWQAQWGHPVLAVESFVDESQSRGTGDRACGFATVGLTQGFGRSSRDFYLRHGQPKQLYVRELQPGARALLRRARWSAEWAAHEAEGAGSCPFRAAALGDLLARFATLPEARRGHGLWYRQRFVLACAAGATLMGAGGYRAFENTARKFTPRHRKALGAQWDDEEQRYGAPRDSPFRRVLMRVDAAAFASLVGGWLATQEVGALARLAVDGKGLRGSGRHDGKPLQLLSAVTPHLRLTLDQVAMEEKSNEITALKPWRAHIQPPPGTLITADAMHCQQARARLITQEWGGDDLFGLKGNQTGVLDKAQRLLAQQAFPP